MSGLGLLKDDIFLHFPPSWRESDDPEWRAFADLLNKYRAEVVDSGGQDGIYSIEDFDSFLSAERIPEKFLSYLVTTYGAHVYSEDTVRQIREKIFSAIPEAKLNGTIELLLKRIKEITVVQPEHYVFVDTSTGWDELGDITPPKSVAVDFLEGILWDEKNDFDTVNPPFIFVETSYGIRVDIKVDPFTLTQLQRDRVLQVIAELKPADLKVSVGYNGIFWRDVFSTDLSITSWPNNPDPLA